MSRYGDTELVFERVSYDSGAKDWLKRSGHYLQNPPPGCLFAVAAREAVPGLFGDVGGDLRGLCLVGRPVSRKHPQNGTWGEVIRLAVDDGLPHGTASALLRFALRVAALRGMATVISYHDRTRHSGCVYRKSGFRKWGLTQPNARGWSTRGGRVSAALPGTSKRRWRIDL